MAASDIQLRAHDLPDEAIEELILKALRETRGAITVSDLVLRTGLNPVTLEPVFRQMVLRYETHVEVSEDGGLSYHFDPALTPIDGGEALRRYRFRKRLWAIFKVFYKILIVVVLVGYVLLFLALMIALFVAKSQSKSESESRSGGQRSQGGSSSGNTLYNYWLIRSLMGSRGGVFRPSSRYEPAPPEDPRPFWEKVFSYVFGHELEVDDPLVDRRELLAFIVEKDGVVAPMELSARTGWSPEASERESSRLLAEYDGGVELLSDGQTVFAFEDMRERVPPRVQALPFFWERFEFKASYSGNTAGATVLITALNLFVLVSSLFFAPGYIIPGFIAPMYPELLAPSVIGLVAIPAIFSLSFFLIPLWRQTRITKPENAARRRRNARRIVLAEVYSRASRGQTVMEEFDVLDAALRHRRPEDAILPDALQPAVTEALREIAHEWGARQDINDEGRRVYDFYRIPAQLRDAAAYRARPGSIRLRRMQDEFAAFDAEVAEGRGEVAAQPPPMPREGAATNPPPMPARDGSDEVEEAEEIGAAEGRARGRKFEF